MHSRELLMMGREDAWNMWSFITEYIWITSASGWLFIKKYITMHGNMNVKNIDRSDRSLVGGLHR